MEKAALFCIQTQNNSRASQDNSQQAQLIVIYANNLKIEHSTVSWQGKKQSQSVLF